MTLPAYKIDSHYASLTLGSLRLKLDFPHFFRTNVKKNNLLQKYTPPSGQQRNNALATD